jgi:regulator of sigma E protease
MSFHAISDFLRFPLAFVVLLGPLVFIHELGHYLAARWRGVHVEAFSVGFGRTLIGWTDKRGTDWKISWIPLGGYVRLNGQERPEDVTDDVRARWIKGHTFHEKTVASRAIIVAAGPAANMVLALVLYSLLFGTVGQEVIQAVPPPVIGDVLPGMPAARAGIQAGDRVVQIDAEPTTRFEDVQRIVTAHPSVPLDLLIQRGDQRLHLTVTPEARDDGHGGHVGKLGVQVAGEFVRLSPLAAIEAGAMHTWNITRDTVIGIGEILSGRRGTEDIGGPLRIAQLAGEVAQLGIVSFITLIAGLSINLGLINLFPIPVLDGGHLLLYAVEAIRGRPVPPRAQEYGFRAGLALLVGLFIFATWNDLTHFGLFRWFAGLTG